jgi:U3 small nucleolar RNA-associated protein 21
MSSQLFQSYRAIGLVSDDIAFVVQKRGSQTFVTTSIGEAFQVYKCEKLQLSLVSPRIPERITALAVKGDLTFTACGNEIITWNRTKKVGTFVGHRSPVSRLLVMGDFLISTSENGPMKVWDIDTRALQADIALPDPKEFTITSLMHPYVYLDKILIASQEGQMQLWNIKKRKLVHNFEGWGSPIITVEQSPAIDVVGVGLGDGRVVVHNLKYDETIMTLKQSKSQTTTLSFRSDAADSGILASGTEHGQINLWNLHKKRLESTIENAHDAKVIKLQFLANEPMLISLGSDNSIKMWLFDAPDGSGRLLRSRQGHSAPPTQIDYYGAVTSASDVDGSDGTSLQLLSAGRDQQLRVFHAVREQQNMELSQQKLLSNKGGNGRKRSRFDSSSHLGDLSMGTGRRRRLPPITTFVSAETREAEWANIVSVHEQDPSVYVWRFDRRSIEPFCLRQYDPSQPAPDGSLEARLRADTVATAVCISACGHYALVGTVGGCTYKYNLQSGQRRGSYPTAATGARKLKRALTLKGVNDNMKVDESADDRHEGPVTGIAVDALNSLVVSVGADGSMRFWSFVGHELLKLPASSGDADANGALKIGAAASKLVLHRDSGLAAVSCDDISVRVFDIVTRRLVRRFDGHEHRITDLCFSADARTLVTASMDGSVRAWDLPTGQCIDWMRFEKPVVSLAFSPSGEFLTTAHAGSLGLCLWANKAYYSTVYSRSRPSAPYQMDLPPPAAPAGDGDDEADSQLSYDAQVEEAGDMEIDGDVDSDGQSSASSPRPGANASHKGLVTLSSLPRSQWQTLFRLELIRARNKPTEPPKAPEKAPFFLQTVYRTDDTKGVTAIFEAADEDDEGNEGSSKSDDKGGAKGGAKEGGDGAWDESGAWSDNDDDDDGDGEEAQSRIMRSGGAAKADRGELASMFERMAARLKEERKEEEEEDEEEGEEQRGGKKQKRRQLQQRARKRVKGAQSGGDGSASEVASLAYKPVLEFLKKCPASKVDVEFRSLCLGDFDAEGIDLIGYGLDFFTLEIGRRSDFEALEAYLNRYLRIHAGMLFLLFLRLSSMY